MSNFQFDLVTATVRSQTTISNKQNADASAGVVANALLQNEYTEATDLLNNDQATTNSTGPTSPDGTWNTNQTQDFSAANANYQNDAAVSQTGETNASTGTTNIQSQVSEDSTNLSNLVSLAQTLIQIGGYVAGLINNAYT